MIFVGVALLCSLAHAQSEGEESPAASASRSAVQLQVKKTPKLTVFNFGSELVQTSTEGRSIMGVGPRVGFEYNMAEKLSMAASITFALQASGKLGAYFYSGFAGSFRYTFSGTNVRDHVQITDAGKVVMDYERVSRARWQAAFGIEQLFLNGSANIYPAVGFFGQIVHGLRIWDHDFETDFRIAQLQANDKPFMLIGAGLSMSFDF